jgi:hypothetical protein
MFVDLRVLESCPVFSEKSVILISAAEVNGLMPCRAWSLLPAAAAFLVTVGFLDCKATTTGVPGQAWRSTPASAPFSGQCDWIQPQKIHAPLSCLTGLTG